MRCFCRVPRRRRALALAAATWLVSGATSAAADEARGIRCAASTPVAVRDSALLLPLAAERPGDRWPADIRVRIGENGPVFEAPVVWIEAAPPPAHVGWTQDFYAPSVRPIQPTDDTSRDAGAPFLLVPTPADAAGRLYLLGGSIAPQWFDRPLSPTRWESDNVVVEPLLLSRAPDRPDPESPFEYWRWVLLADRLGMAPPPPPFDEIGSLVARYYADLWRLGLERIARESPGVADRCREILTATCRDGGTAFAAWEADPVALARLLGLVLNTSLPAPRLAREALEWADARDLTLLWLEKTHGGTVRLAGANPRREPIVVQFRWIFDDPERNRREIPIAIELLPGEVTRTTLDRPLPEIDRLGRARPMGRPRLAATWNGRDRVFLVPDPVEVAHPPGVLAYPFHRPLSLGQVQAAEPAPVPLSRSTAATLRRVGGRWELFFQCARPAATLGPGAASGADLAGAAGPYQTRGIEAVSFWIGPPDEPAIVTVPESGEPRLWSGEEYADTLEIHRRGYEDRWYARVVLPDEWLDYPLSPAVLMGFVRTHGGDEAMESAPLPTLPWAPDPGRIAVDTTQWFDLPG